MTDRQRIEQIIEDAKLFTATDGKQGISKEQAVVAVLDFFGSYKQQVLDEVEGRLPEKEPEGSTSINHGYKYAGFNDCLDQVHQVIAEMKEQS